MAKVRKLVLTLNNQDAAQSIHWDKLSSNAITLIAVMGESPKVKMVSDSVLIINFETGELRLDIDLDNLNNMKYER